MYFLYSRMVIFFRRSMDVVQCGKHSIVWQNELWINKKITTANISSIFTGAWTNSHWDLIHKWYTVLCLEWFYHDIVFVFLQGRWSISSISHKTLHQQRLLTSSSVSHLNQHESVISLNSYFKASDEHCSIGMLPSKKRVNLNFVPLWNWQFAPGLKPGLVQMSFPFWVLEFRPPARCELLIFVEFTTREGKNRWIYSRYTWYDTMS